MADRARLVGESIQYASGVPDARSTHFENTYRAFRLTIGAGQAVWLTDGSPEAFAALPGNAVFIDAPQAEGGLPTVTRSPGFSTGKMTLGTGAY